MVFIFKLLFKRFMWEFVRCVYVRICTTSNISPETSGEFYVTLFLERCYVRCWKKSLRSIFLTSSDCAFLILLCHSLSLLIWTILCRNKYAVSNRRQNFKPVIINWTLEYSPFKHMDNLLVKKYFSGMSPSPESSTLWSQEAAVWFHFQTAESNP
jgi:hypothetical protein